MEDAKRIAVAGYRQVLEDGRNLCDSESDAEYSDHGEVLEGMYTDGATLSSACFTTEQANALRAAGRAGAPVTMGAPFCVGNQVHARGSTAGSSN
jgi:hypothetical protein